MKTLIGHAEAFGPLSQAIINSQDR